MNESSMTKQKDNCETGWYAKGTKGVVAAGEADAVAAGITVLKNGGNAIDAAVATLLALSITDYGSFALGGEIPLMFFNAEERKVQVLCGVGCAPNSKEAIQWYIENGIPAEGGLKASPVPAALDLCVTALCLYGSISLEQAITASLELLSHRREHWHENLANTLRKLAETERKTPGSRETKLIAARNCFYKGEVADRLEQFYIANGSFLRKFDLANHVTRVENPVSVQYRGFTIHKCGPWSQGPSLCQALRLLEGFDLKTMGHLSGDYVHTVVESLKLALADRDRYYTDPLFTEVPMDALLSDSYTDIRRNLIDLNHASNAIRPGNPFAKEIINNAEKQEQWMGGTTTCVVSDKWGNVVAATLTCPINTADQICTSFILYKSWWSKQ